jgi:hypothetical protein
LEQPHRRRLHEGLQRQPVIMSSAEQHREALDLVVGADGSGVIDAAQLARWGVEPGRTCASCP